jgi:CotH kinase protein/Lamin Tail Domain/Secretion system C-terminal sorting domain
MKNFILSILCFLNCTSIFSQKLYDINTIQNIELTFAFSDWDAKMDAAAASPADGYTVAVSCKINGVQFDSVGVKFKGNSSYKAANKKNPLHIELNYIKGKQDYKGYTDLKLSSGFSDATFVREALSYTILRDYLDVPDANFANVYINGAKYGFFTNVQNINSVFLKDHFDETNGTFVKCTPAAGAGGGGGGGLTAYCTMKYLGKDSSLYKTKYDMKTVGGFKDLITLCDTMSNKPAGIAKVIDVNRSIWMLAFNSLLSNYDSYTGTFCQNYYLYKDKTNRFLPILWDLNMAFGSFNIGGTGDVSKTDAFLHKTNVERPLIKNILSNPTYKKMYVAHIKTMIDDWFANGKYLTLGAEMQAIADTAYNADPNKLFTYSSFKTALTTSVPGSGTGGAGAPSIKGVMESRMTYYKTLVEFQKTAPTISPVDAIKALIGKPVNITLKIQDATSAVLNYRFEKNAVFQTESLFDDGLHNDGAANDGVWSTTITPQKPDCQYYIYAENNDAGIFSPRQAEHVFYNFTATAPNAILPGEVIVNEFMANNVSIVTAPNGKFSDWMELHNTTNKEIDLSNAALSDNISSPKKWLFPVGTKIKAKEYLIVWADGGDTGTGLHAAFKLADAGEEFIFSDPNGVVLDSLTFKNQKSDLSHARCPNGAAKWVNTNATFAATNGDCKKVSGVSDNFSVYDDLKISPNPTNDILTVNNNNFTIGKITMYDLTGKIMLHTTFDTSEAILDISFFPQGLYLLKTQSGKVLKVVKN